MSDAGFENSQTSQLLMVFDRFRLLVTVAYQQMLDMRAVFSHSSLEDRVKWNLVNSSQQERG